MSQTKAINTGTYLWFEHELAVMRDVGNAVAARAFEHQGLPCKPSRDAPASEKLAYATAKYVDAQPDWIAAVAAQRCVTRPKPASPTAVPPVVSRRARATTRLPGARREADMHDDLIIFDATENQGLWINTPVKQGSAVDPEESCTSGNSETQKSSLHSRQADAMHEKKKADVLAQFAHQGHQPGLQAPRLPMAGLTHNGNAFFEQFGL